MRDSKHQDLIDEADEEDEEAESPEPRAAAAESGGNAALGEEE